MTKKLTILSLIFIFSVLLMPSTMAFSRNYHNTLKEKEAVFQNFSQNTEQKREINKFQDEAVLEAILEANYEKFELALKNLSEKFNRGKGMLRNNLNLDKFNALVERFQNREMIRANCPHYNQD